MLSKLIRYFLEQKLVVLLLALLVIIWGARTAPFDWDLGGLPRDPIAVDAIPDIGENQQIIFTEWMGRSHQDKEDQDKDHHQDREDLADQEAQAARHQDQEVHHLAILNTEDHHQALQEDHHRAEADHLQAIHSTEDRLQVHQADLQIH